MTLDQMTPSQQEIAAEFLYKLQEGVIVDYRDFPHVPREEFEKIADAVVAAFKPQFH